MILLESTRYGPTLDSGGQALSGSGLRWAKGLKWEHEQVEHVWVTGPPGLEWFLPSKYIIIS